MCARSVLIRRAPIASSKGGSPPIFVGTPEHAVRRPTPATPRRDEPTSPISADCGRREARVNAPRLNMFFHRLAWISLLIAGCQSAGKSDGKGVVDDSEPPAIPLAGGKADDAA